MRIVLLILISFLIASLAEASDACPAPAPPPADVGSDGTAWLIVRDDVRSCLVAVTEDGDNVVVARWPRAGGTAPVAVAAMFDGRAALVRPSGGRWRLSVRDLNGVEAPLAVWLPSPPDALLAHPTLPLVAVRMIRPDGHARAWLVDVERGAVVAMGSVSARDLMTFPSDAGVLRVGAELLASPGRSSASEANDAPFN